MAEIPMPTTMTEEEAFARLQAWFLEKAQLNKLKQHEHMERVAVTGYYFRAPEEGTNRLELGGGYDLVLTHSFNRKVDESALDNVTADDIKRLALPW